MICSRPNLYAGRGRNTLACVARVPVRAEREKSFFASGRAKNRARAKRSKERGGGGERRERLPANPSILKNAHRLFTVHFTQMIDSLSLSKPIPNEKKSKLTRIWQATANTDLKAEVVKSLEKRCQKKWLTTRDPKVFCS